MRSTRPSRYSAGSRDLGEFVVRIRRLLSGASTPSITLSKPPSVIFFGDRGAGGSTDVGREGSLRLGSRTTSAHEWPGGGAGVTWFFCHCFCALLTSESIRSCNSASVKIIFGVVVSF